MWPRLGLGGTKTCFCLLICPLQLSQTHRAGEVLPKGLRLIELVALAGVLGLCLQVVQVLDGHGGFPGAGFKLAGWGGECVRR